MRSPAFARVMLAASLVMTIAAVAVVLAINLLAPRALPDDALQRVVLLQRADMAAQAEPILERMLDEQPLALELHARYLANHFAIRSSPGARRDDSTIEQRYTRLAAAPQTAAIGLYGLGVISAAAGRHAEAIALFLQIDNGTHSFVQSALGMSYLALGDKGRAEDALRAEVLLGGGVQAAVAGLEKIYSLRRDNGALHALLADPVTAPFASTAARRAVALADGDILTYVRLVVVSPWQRLDAGAALAAAIICLMWFIYLWRIDVFEQQSPRVMLACLGMGATGALSVGPLTDLLAMIYPLPLGGSRLSDFGHSLLYIGLLEEVAKFVPVLLVARLTQEIDEPVDFMIYGGLAGLGFATLENGLYFTGYGLGIVVTRFLLSTVLHMAMTGIACAGWAYARHTRWRKPGQTALLGAGGLALAVAAHGIFDYLIIARLELFASLSILVALALAVTYGLLIRAFLDISPFARRSTELAGRLTNYALLYVTSLILLLMTYIYNHAQFSTEIANAKELHQGLTTVFLIIIIFSALGEISVRVRPAWPRSEGSGWEDFGG